MTSWREAGERVRPQLMPPLRIPVPKPVREPNRFNLEPLNPETPKIALYLVLAPGRLTLQVVCLGLAHFRLPARLQQAAFRMSRLVVSHPWRHFCGGGSAGRALAAALVCFRGSGWLGRIRFGRKALLVVFRQQEEVFDLRANGTAALGIDLTAAALEPSHFNRPEN